MSCAGCGIVALAGPDGSESITERLGTNGMYIALGAIGGLVGYALVPSKWIGALIGTGAWAGAAWYMTKNGQAVPTVTNELPPTVSVPALIPSAHSLPALPVTSGDSGTDLTPLQPSMLLKCRSR